MKEVFTVIQLKKSSALGKVVGRTLRAKSTDTARPYFTAGYWDKDAGALIATDGRRLHMLESDQLAELLAGVDQNCYVVQKGDALALYSVDTFGPFPNYRRVIPAADDLYRIDSIDPNNKVGTASLRLPLDLSDKGRVNRCAGYIMLAMGNPLDVGYLQDLAGGAYELYNHKASTHPNAYAARMFVDNAKGYKFTAVIMPMVAP